MTTLALSIHSVYRNTLTGFLKMSWKLVYFSAILISLSMLVFYIYSVNKLTEEVYLIKKYTNELSTLSNENKALEVDFAKSDILSKTINRAKELSFEKVSNIKYMQIVSNDSLAIINR